jgi:RNA polymerase sigma-70 factor, ECF subfamily
VARYLVGGWRKVPGDPTFTRTEVNGDTALLVTTGGRPLAVIALEFQNTLVTGIRIIANPEKLSHLTVLLSSQGV